MFLKVNYRSAWFVGEPDEQQRKMLDKLADRSIDEYVACHFSSYRWKQAAIAQLIASPLVGIGFYIVTGDFPYLNSLLALIALVYLVTLSSTVTRRRERVATLDLRDNKDASYRILVDELDIASPEIGLVKHEIDDYFRICTVADETVKANGEQLSQEIIFEMMLMAEGLALKLKQAVAQQALSAHEAAVFIDTHVADSIKLQRQIKEQMG